MTEEVNTNYLGVTPGIANYITQEVGDVDLSEYYTKSEIDSKIDSIEAGGDVVLNNYYTKSESDNKFVAKGEEVNVDLTNYYTKTEVDSKIDAIDNENTDSLWTLENGQTIACFNRNENSYYPAVSMRHDAETRSGNVNSAVLRLVNQCTTYSAPFIVFLGKNDQRFAHILHNPIANYFEIAGYEGAYFRFSTVNDHMYVSNLYSIDEVPYALQSYAYSKSESDSKYALKSESGNIDLSGYYTKTESDNRFALKSESGNIDWSNIDEENISMTASDRMYLSTGGDFELYCNGIFRLTSPNGLNISGQPLYDEREESYYATENYVNTKIGEIKLSDLTTHVLENFDMQCTGRIGIDTSDEISLTAESNVTISAYKDLLLKTENGSVKIEGSKLYDVNTESNYATTKDIETELANYATTEYVNSAIQNVSSGSIDESKFVKQPKILNADVLEDPAITYKY